MVRQIESCEQDAKMTAFAIMVILKKVMFVTIPGSILSSRDTFISCDRFLKT